MKLATENPFIIKEKKYFAVIRWIVLPFLIAAAPALFFIRIAIAIIELTFYGVLARLVDKDYPKPLSPFRHRLQRIVCCLFGASLLFNDQWFAFQRGKLDKKQKVIVMNHTSTLDTPVACRYFSGHAVSKASVANYWVFRAIFRMTRSILVKREGEKLKPEVEELVCTSGTQRMRELIATSKDPVVIFPEGTVAATGKLMRFKTSAFTLNVPIQPITIRYYSILDNIWTTHHWAAHMFNILANPIGIAVVTYHQVMEQKKDEDYQQFADRVGKYMADYLGYTYTNYQVQDYVYFRYGKGKPTDEYMKDFGWMGTLKEFSKKYKVQYWSGLKSWQVEHITLPTEK